MLRYNISHRGVEEDVFPLLRGDKATDPGIVVFNVAHEGLRFFDHPSPGYPAGYPVPTIPDCYRFALSHPSVDLVLTGVKDRAQLDEALAAVEKGPFESRQMDFMRKYGIVHANRGRVRVSTGSAAAASGI